MKSNWDSDAGTAGTQAPVAGSVNPGTAVNALSLTVSGADFFDMTGDVVLDGAPMSLDASNLTTSGALGINTVSSQMSSLSISAGSYASFQFLANIDASLTGDAILELRGAGNPVNGSTIDLAADSTGYVRFLGETVTDVTVEHLSKFTVGGAAAVLGTNMEIVSENGATVVRVIHASCGSSELHQRTEKSMNDGLSLLTGSYLDTQASNNVYEVLQENKTFWR